MSSVLSTSLGGGPALRETGRALRDCYDSSRLTVNTGYHIAHENHETSRGEWTPIIIPIDIPMLVPIFTPPTPRKQTIPRILGPRATWSEAYEALDDFL